MKNKVKLLREQKNMTQNELAEKSGLSLRTIQRIEAGNILKGYTLKAIADALETQPENLVIEDLENVDRAKIINFSALLGLIIPFGGVIFPLILTYKTKDQKNKKIGKEIVSVQIILTIIFSVLLIISPFLQKTFSIKFPVFMIPLIAFIIIKLFIIIRNGMSLNQTNELHIKLKTNFL